MQNTWYFFSVAGINITQKLLNSLVHPLATTEELIDLDKYLIVYHKKIKTDKDFNRVMTFLYILCF